MVTRGWIVYRYGGRYCRRYMKYDSHSSNLGCKLRAQVPTNRDAFGRWLEEMRKFCNAPHAQYPNGSEWEVTKEQLRNDVVSWVYEFDLDHLIFHIDAEPVFRLDNMPPKDVFMRCICMDSYGFRAPAIDTPVEYRAPSHGTPPPIPESALESFHRLKNDAGPSPVYYLLSRAPLPSTRETCCIKMLEVYVGLVMNDLKFHQTIRDLPTAPDSVHIDCKARWLMYRMVRLATCPVYYRGARSLVDEVIAPDGEFWWIRKHICVRPSTHLYDERCLQYAMAELVSEITSLEGPKITYGIAFSLTHCAIIRVNRSNGGSVMYTEALNFIPSRYAESASTPGISALVRVGDLSAADDPLFFLSVGRPPTWETPVKTSCVNANTPSNNQVFPLELLMIVADNIEDVKTLTAFAWSSKPTMAAALPWLKYPQINVYWNFLPDPGRAVETSYCDQLGTALLRSDIGILPDAGHHDRLLTGRFLTFIPKYGDVEITVTDGNLERNMFRIRW